MLDVSSLSPFPHPVNFGLATNMSKNHNMPPDADPSNADYHGASSAGASQGPASLPHPPAHTPATHSFNRSCTLPMTAAGGFSDLASRIDPVPAATVNAASARMRLTQLKNKFNQLQRKRASYHGRQAANGGVAVASALFTAGGSLLVQGPAALHQRNRLQQIVRAMRECLEQINLLRNIFGDTAGWATVEEAVQCDPNAFTNALNRQELHGDL